MRCPHRAALGSARLHSATAATRSSRFLRFAALLSLPSTSRKYKIKSALPIPTSVAGQKGAGGFAGEFPLIHPSAVGANFVRPLRSDNLDPPLAATSHLSAPHPTGDFAGLRPAPCPLFCKKAGQKTFIMGIKKQKICDRAVCVKSKICFCIQTGGRRRPPLQ